MFRKFDMEVSLTIWIILRWSFDKFDSYFLFCFQTAPKPIYLAAVNHILRNIPADSRRTFIRAFQVQELAASTAFSMINVCQGAIATGAIKNGSGNGPSYERMLSNCPPIKEFCVADVARMPVLIERCGIIAAEMVTERTMNSVNYLGTPDDQWSYSESFLVLFTLARVIYRRVTESLIWNSSDGGRHY